MVLLDVDPNIVKPGWTPLIITILLAAAITLLMLSMRRHMRKINAPYRDEVAEQSSSPGTSSTAETNPDAGESADGGETPDTGQVSDAGQVRATAGPRTKTDQST